MVSIINNQLGLFFNYLRFPIVPQKVQKTKRINVFFILFIFSLAIDYMITLISRNHWLISSLKIKHIDSDTEYVYKQGLLFAIIVVGIIAPIIEELSQRSYLTSFIWNNAIFPLNVCLIIIKLGNINSKSGLLIIIGSSIIISRYLYVLLLKKEKMKRILLRFYIKQYWLYFYISAIAFGLLHLGNYEIRNFIPILTLALVFAQIFAGLTLGYIRIKMGLKWSICFHALHNLFYIILLFLTHS